MSVVLFAGGGTGGHLMPALAIADAMKTLDPSIEPVFVGAERGIESRVLPARPWRHALLPMEPIYRRQWWKNLRLPWSAWRTRRMMGELIEREQPVLAIGTGGYVAGHALWTLARCGVPIVLQEQNAYPGFATRRLAGRARQIHLGFPEARAFLSPGAMTEVFDSGNPIQAPEGGRRQAAAVDRRLQAAAGRRALGFDPDRPLVLIIGGSQGALAINRAVAAAIEAGAWPRDVQLLWQTGAATFEQFRRHTTDAVRVSAFIDPIAPAYQAADIVIARAGAMTLAELAAYGLPSILVPLPTAAADHQATNARSLADSGAAVLLEQASLSDRTLVGQVSALLGDPARMADLSRAILARARPDAAREIAHKALRLVSKR